METILLENVTFKMPYYMYSSVSISATKSFILQNLPNNYGYLLTKIVCSWPDVDSAVTGYNNPLYIEIFDTASFKARQVNRLPLDIVSTYCNNHIRADIPVSPASYPTGQLQSIIPFNYFFPYSDILNVQISDGNSFGTSGLTPATIDIVLMGYFIKRQDNVY